MYKYIFNITKGIVIGILKISWRIFMAVFGWAWPYLYKTFYWIFHHWIALILFVAYIATYIAHGWFAFSVPMIVTNIFWPLNLLLLAVGYIISFIGLLVVGTIIIALLISYVLLAIQLFIRMIREGIYDAIHNPPDVHSPIVESILGFTSPYDSDGYDSNGFNRDGRDRKGYDHDGRDKNGFDRNGWDFEGRNHEGRDKWGRYATHRNNGVYKYRRPK